ncbi:hypothetical protein MKK58_12405 [Methylobacterium sp. J-078]|uniref:hypothetical protein n=1 Tax=Methylobacterium sp. J-078 TaxID=2836657 RepID=UPI001FBBEFE0|nr:hypothetical protein [Methylobacterium sp. J-078]MCJ2045324.1 hypothetical protein [Methylobacterium sp. J-078]
MRVSGERLTVQEVVHAILDNDATRPHSTMCGWLARHSRRPAHVAPTSASCLNAAEGCSAP